MPRSFNKQAIQNEFELPVKADIPLLIMISRMDIQKGVDLILETLPEILDQPWQAILLGSGDPNLEKGCARLAKRFRSRVRTVLKFDAALSHRLYAGGDILLMPSRFEPCGLSQMISMRYGCIPVARATGGLKDTITNHPRKSKTGYLFSSATDFSTCLMNALKDFQDLPFWESMQRNAMSVDFSWNNSALEYAKVYQNLLSIA